jgi:hypothetical protein
MLATSRDDKARPSSTASFPAANRSRSISISSSISIIISSSSAVVGCPAFPIAVSVVVIRLGEPRGRHFPPFAPPRGGSSGVCGGGRRWCRFC